MFCSGNDFVLQRLAEIGEIVAVSRNANDEVTILLGVLLRVQQGVCADHIELDVMSTEREIRTHKMGEGLDPLLSFENMRGELLIQQCSPSGRDPFSRPISILPSVHGDRRLERERCLPKGEFRLFSHRVLPLSPSRNRYGMLSAGD